MRGNTPTPHNAAVLGEIAKTVIMPGDPLRAKFVAERFLEGAVEYNHVRGMLGYTGTYRGKRISVQGHGMGIPSIGIYTYELYRFYDVQNIIRIGSCGGLRPEVRLGDVVIAMGACTDSNYAAQFGLPGTMAPICSYPLLRAAVSAAEEMELPVHVGNVLSTDCFYNANRETGKRWAAMGVLAGEMEASALYCNAAAAGKQALCITTVSDHADGGEAMSAEQRQQGLEDMIRLALETAVKL